MISKDRKVSNGIKILFVYYIIWLIFIVLFKMSFSYDDLIISREINLIPFNYKNNADSSIILGEIFYNILIFIPLGILLRSINYGKSVYRSIVFVILFSTIIEAMQYILAIGIFDITDIINNSTGSIIGIGIYNFFINNYKKKIRTDKIILIIGIIIAVALTAIILTLLIENK